MKQLLSVALLLLALNGCVKRALAPAAHMVLPRSCITDLRFTQNAVCHPRGDGSFSCNGVVVKAACMKMVPPCPSCKKPAGTEHAQN
jgi:hypothetical protein